MKDCINYIGYSIDETGKVFSHRRRMGRGKNGGKGSQVVVDPNYSRQVKEQIGIAGYPTVYLQVNGESKSAFVHRLIAEAYIPNPQNLPCVNHINFNILDYSIGNLEWVSFSENNKHSVRHGRMGGEKCNLHKLTAEQVLQVRELCKTGKQTKLIADRFGVHPDTIRLIKRRKIWAYI